MQKFQKYKLGVTSLHVSKTDKETKAVSSKVLMKQANGEDVLYTIKDLTDAGVPEDEIERHIELGTIIGIKGTEIEEKPKDTK